MYMQVNIENTWPCRHRNWSYDPRDKTSFDVTALYRIDWHDPPRYDKWLYTRDESVITGKDVRTRKTRECTYTHGYTRGTGWRGRMDAVRPYHDTTIRVCETSLSWEERNTEKKRDGNGQWERKSSKIGICAIPIVSARKQNTSRDDLATFY